MDLQKYVDLLVKRIPEGLHPRAIYGVPRGGIPVAYEVAKRLPGAEVVFDVNIADLIVDDIIDSGKTMERYARLEVPFLALVDKRKKDTDHGWVVFPWEQDEVRSKEDIPLRLLQAIGEDTTRDGLLNTPKRVVKSWEELYGGYKKKVSDVVTVFENDGRYDEMVVLKDIEFFSTCEHHLLPFFGKAHIGYIPSRKIIGISKLARILNIFARRAQVQERLTQQVADALWDILEEPIGVGVVLEAQHTCMLARGVKQSEACMVTSALKGVLKTTSESRAEFMSFIHAERR